MTECEHDWKTFAQLFSFGSLTQFQRCTKCKLGRVVHPDEPELDYDEDYEEGCE